MSSKTSNRGFGYGCRDTPDVFNKYLEQMGFYRKHVATDSSSLFRVVSELQYDIQLYHSKVRAECVKFMSSHKPLFIKDIRYGFDAYVTNIARPRTYGSLVELRALALHYRANVFLFEPYTEGKWYMYNSKNTVTWRVFIGRDNHFDVVYPLEEIKSAAICQALVYQLLYSKVLALPDVEYAVERMLHDPQDKLIRYEKNKAGTTVALTEDGRRLELTKPGRGTTRCVLKHPHLCHFHNQTNFPFIERFFVEHGPEEGCRVYIGSNFRYTANKSNPLLREAKVSCVRQLLASGITPFPYKVAKALDPNIYRNVEYDVWQDIREERMIQMLGIDKRFHNLKFGKRLKHVTPLHMLEKEMKFKAEVVMADLNASEPAQNATEPEAEGLESDSPLTVAPYPMPSIYFPTPDQFGYNTVGIIPSDANHLTLADAIGVPTCLCKHLPQSPSMFHTPAPLTPLQQGPPPQTVQSNESLAVPDLITLVPHTLNHQPMQNEYLVMFDSPYQSPQAQQPQQHHHQQQQHHHLPYLHLSPHQQQQQQQQQPQHPYNQQQPHQHEQPQQQIAAATFQPRCLYHCVQNGNETNNRSTLSMTYETSSFTTLQPPAPGSPGFWRI
ncbi:protein ovarian tumor locus-like isoform X2 [Anopheles stephensi]|uniref:protein ovarian tumor locus-like isoform X2 n=1 Tax=Anopheles stephensi TaxID=30069 RepID=UPI0016587AA6|nr:protein ovarian tumor locus-like isoform X2 [Anopheles stephensi]